MKNIKTIKHLFFIDSRVSDYEALINQIPEDSAWVLLSDNKDGIEQMATAVAGYSGLDSIQIISHGTEGKLYLGDTTLNNQNLANYTLQLKVIGDAISDTGDLLLYGCNVAGGSVGQSFINQLAVATGADIAASDDITSSVNFDGDLVLEKIAGQIDSQAIDLQGLLALAVNTAPTFSVSDGKLVTDLGGRDIGRSVIQQADGKLVVAGGDGNFYIARYLPDGTLDTSFNSTGYQSTDISLLSDDTGYSVIQQSDEKLVVAGSSNGDFALVRYNKDGTLDASFDEDGKLVTDLNNYSSDTGRCVIQQTDGKLVIAGGINNWIEPHFALVRYNNDGTLDSGFGENGTVKTTFGDGTYLDGAYSVIQQNDGKLIVGGRTNNNFGLARYNLDGSLDETFGQGGMLTTDFGGFYGSEDEAYCILQQDDGKIVVSGSSNTQFTLARYDLNGELDTTFDTDGKVVTNFGGYGSGWDSPTSIVQQTDGKLVVAGTFESHFQLVRYNSDGSLDQSFDLDGKVETSFSQFQFNPAEAFSIIQQLDGMLVVAGTSEENFALARYNLDGSLDTTFSPAESALGNNVNYTESGGWNNYVNYVVLSSNASIYDAELSASGNYNGSLVTLSRSGGANAQDVFRASGILSSLIEGSYFSVDDVTIGRVNANSGGILKLAFNNKATQSLVDKALQNITYGNTSDAPPESVVIDWVFNDGNSGSQGTGGAKSVTGQTIINITEDNDIPVSGYLIEDLTVTPNTPFVYNLPTGSFSDPDLEPLAYSVRMQDFTAIPPWLEVNPLTGQLSGTPDESDVGVFALQIRAVDSSGMAAYDSFVLTVPASPLLDQTAPIVVSASPVDGAKDVPEYSSIAFTFSEEIEKGSGNIYLRKDSPTGEIVQSLDVTSGNGVYIRGDYPYLTTNVLTVMPGRLLSATDYFLTIESGALKDLAGNESGEIVYEFSTRQAKVTNGTAGNDTVNIPRPSGLSLYVFNENDVVNLDAGNDTVDSGGGIDLIDGGSGIDTVSFKSVSGSGFNYSLYGVNVSLDLAESQIYNASGDEVTLISVENIVGSGLDDTLVGNHFDNLLDGHLGTDVLMGGLGNDTYIVDRIGDKVIEDENEGIDLVQASSTYTLGDDVENIQLTGVSNISAVGNSLDNVLFGNAGSNVLNGGAGIDTVSFINATKAVAANLTTKKATGFGTDTLTNIENLIGSNFNDSLTGSATANKIEGGVGNDIIDGGNGTDTAVYTLARTNYTVTFNAGTLVYTVKANSGSEGTDTVKNVENFSFSDGTFLASSLIDSIAPTVSTFSPTDGMTGVALGSNIVLTFSEAIQKGTGTIYLRSGSASGNLVEEFNAATSDRISVSGTTLTIDPTSNLAANTQYFVTFASGTVKDLAGNAYTGTSTYDFRTGAAPITGTEGNNTLTGTANADVINGLGGNDILTGAGAVDTMNGGNDSDLYIIAATADHSAAEIADSGMSGTDEVRITATSASTFTLYAGDTGIETFVVGTGTAATAVSTATTAINVNAAAVLNGLTITGNAGANILTGTAYNDIIIGNAGNDTISAGVGIDTVNGGVGADSLTGGAGKDTFVFAAGSSGQATGKIDVITDLAKGVVGTGDLIDYSANLTIGGSNVAASSSQAQINATTGVATFASGSGTTLSDALADIASRFSAATNSAGEFALFRVNNTGNYYAFISDGTGGVTANDVVVQLTGVTTIGSIDLTGGNLTLLS